MGGRLSQQLESVLQGVSTGSDHSEGSCTSTGNAEPAPGGQLCPGVPLTAGTHLLLLIFLRDPPSQLRDGAFPGCSGPSCHVLRDSLGPPQQAVTRWEQWPCWHRMGRKESATWLTWKLHRFPANLSFQLNHGQSWLPPANPGNDMEPNVLQPQFSLPSAVLPSACLTPPGEMASGSPLGFATDVHGPMPCVALHHFSKLALSWVRAPTSPLSCSRSSWLFSQLSHLYKVGSNPHDLGRDVESKRLP